MKYDWDIVSKHKVKIVGWPELVKFTNPSKIGTVDEIQKLCQALKVGECKWVAQSRRQQAAHTEMLSAKVAAGELVVKKRKQRSDKGKTRGKGDKKAAAGKAGKCTWDNEEGSAGDEDDDGKEQERRQPPKKKRKSVATVMARTVKKLPPAPKSKAFISESTDNDEA
ncbi:hypothetical protein L208DRAFT_1381503 [Tricholoma matsutake]|nr:hypothetical protein L208DRAFT_1381503 [Tricholoma matsutake 945]